MNLLHSSASTMARLIREGAISSAELMSLHIRRIEEVNPALNAVVTPLFDSAMKQARMADQLRSSGQLLGPLHGVPISVKDSIDVEGVATTAGHLGLQGAAPAATDATVVARLRAAGAIPIAKTNLPDLLFAFESDNFLFGRTNNPYNLDRTAGGSSGGESALLAACGSPLGLGSDAAGSVRIPAAFCGISALKPTSGRWPRTGHVPPAGGWVTELWQIGPMARSVADLQLALDLCSGADGLDFSASPADLDKPADLRRLRAAVFTDNGFIGVEPALGETVSRAAEALETLGIQVTEVTPPGVEHAYQLELSLLGADGGASLESYVRSLGSKQLHPLLVNGFLNRMRQRAVSSAQFAQIWNSWDTYRREIEFFFRSFDAIICPVYTKAGLRHGDSLSEENFRGFSYTMAWNVAGLPAATVRFGESEGLPVNVQVVTGRWQDRLALQICRQLEDIAGGWQPSNALEQR